MVSRPEIDVTIMDPTRAALVREARSWKGVRFRHYGRTRESGVDCAQLMLNVKKNVLGGDVDHQAYSKRPDQRLAWSEVRKYADRISPESAGPGDVVLMEWGLGTTHYGILTDRGVIHASMQHRRVVEHGLEAFDRIRAYYRLKGVSPWRH